ncbi:phage holin family protein [Sporolactobacillus shoreicorticis]|uniref:Phage holin n=1 Tax=Sporolactobacillus shoreicorticis TaxID=1923877 RepID=A0ABW5RZ18_9BACL|nr:phage holin [Sporolactobacillus shoreicorticis]MCO7128263.1 phage holin family protein [Sporolactobacillus shoreicorticis]
MVRFKNKTFVVAFVAQVIGIVAAVIALGNSAGWWSVQFDSKALIDQLTQAVAVVFTLLGTLGVVQIRQPQASETASARVHRAKEKC